MHIHGTSVALATCRAFAKYAETIKSVVEKDLTDSTDSNVMEEKYPIFVSMTRILEVAKTPTDRINEDIKEKAVKGVFFLYKYFDRIVKDYNLTGDDIDLMGACSYFVYSRTN